MLNPFFLDKSDPGSWKALNGVAQRRSTPHCSGVR